MSGTKSLGGAKSWHTTKPSASKHVSQFQQPSAEPTDARVATRFRLGNGHARKEPAGNTSNQHSQPSEQERTGAAWRTSGESPAKPKAVRATSPARNERTKAGTDPAAEDLRHEGAAGTQQVRRDSERLKIGKWQCTHSNDMRAHTQDCDMVVPRARAAPARIRPCRADRSLHIECIRGDKAGQTPPARRIPSGAPSMSTRSAFWPSNSAITASAVRCHSQGTGLRCKKADGARSPAALCRL